MSQWLHSVWGFNWLLLTNHDSGDLKSLILNWINEHTPEYIYIPWKKKNYKFFENDFLGVFEKRSIKQQIYNRWSWVNKTFAYNQTIPNPPTLPILKHM